MTKKKVKAVKHILDQEQRLALSVKTTSETVQSPVQNGDKMKLAETYKNASAFPERSKVLHVLRTETTR